ncbi:hypothetical protein DEM27_20160 [Metarhizobium album]|uniref:Uncharacterized protein n=1 Tax=Metarhizobium album TaxID=2182425 RepID=A0A2U2DM94_9HYPH|nr:hypothetical protein [Rhizobium album]PWE54426.1 hypothetical protein DEM27_20160 [Rhizobium album]
MSGRHEIEICEPSPFIYYENGQIAVTDGVSVWLIIVTCEAMRATAPPPEKSLRRLVRFAEYYRDIAAAALHRGEDVDGRIWVTEAMVLASPPPVSGRRAVITSRVACGMKAGKRSDMPSMVREFEGYRIAIYSPGGHFAVITAPANNRVLDLKEKQPRSTVVEGPLVCLQRAEALVQILAQTAAAESNGNQNLERAVS